MQKDRRVVLAVEAAVSSRHAGRQLLARRGMAVDVYEKRERPADRLAASLHSYPVRRPAPADRAWS